MKRSHGLCISAVALGLLAGCERGTPYARPAAKQPQEKAASVAAPKDLTKEAFNIWLALVSDWHAHKDASRLSQLAKTAEWGEMPDDACKLVGAKRAFGYRVGEQAVIIGGDEENGSYAVFATSTLDQEALLRMMNQAFYVEPFGELNEAGSLTRMYSLITGGEPVGIASIITSTVESSSGTQIGFAPIELMLKKGVKLPPVLHRLTDMIQQAKGGDPAVQVALGDAYFAGAFGKQENQLALDYWRMAAALKHPAAFTRLGLASYLGIAVPKNLEAAVAYYEMAAEAGDAEGQSHLGWIYTTGEGRPVDEGRAAEWTKKAAAQGNATALNNLGGMYEKGWGVEKDAARSLECYRAAAEKGYATGCVNLGNVYFFGKGVPVNLVEAARWYRAAADKGHADGEYSLGVCYMKGEGVPQELGTAADLFERSAKKGDPRAQNNLGLLLTRGQGRPRDLIEGAKWWVLASAGGNEDATANLPEMRRLLSARDMQEAERRAREFRAEKPDGIRLLESIQSKP